MRVVLASTNQHKLQEIKQILADSDIQIRSLKDFPEIPEPPETQPTFHGNAEQKAVFVHSYTQGIVIADDSGLEVEALDGAPGIHSKRYTPEETADANNTKLLAEMQNIKDRRARFRCVLAIYDGQDTHFVEGDCTGYIATTASGRKGFGYDPVFIPDGHNGKSMAELTIDQKNLISHRGKAFRQLAQVLVSLNE